MRGGLNSSLAFHSTMLLLHAELFNHAFTDQSFKTMSGETKNSARPINKQKMMTTLSQKKTAFVSSLQNVIIC